MKTAVEWLEAHLIEYGFDLSLHKFEINQAKEMEKEQSIDFANNYGFDICGYDYERAEQYYNKTFKSE
jgi:hypothetical protein